MPSNHFTQSITRSFRKLLINKFTNRNSNRPSETANNIGGENESLNISDASTWEQVTLHTPKLENVRVTQILPENEQFASSHTISNQASFWVKRTTFNSDKQGSETNLNMSGFQLPLKVCEKPCRDLGEATSFENEVQLKRCCNSCFTVPKSPKKRCPCEFERAQNRSLEDQKPKKSIFISGYLLNRKSSRAPIRKTPSGNGDFRLTKPLFGRGKLSKRSDPLKFVATLKDDKPLEVMSKAKLTDFESKLQKVENFERMIVDPNYQNETIRLALTPNLLS